MRCINHVEVPSGDLLRLTSHALCSLYVRIVIESPLKSPIDYTVHFTKVIKPLVILLFFRPSKNHFIYGFISVLPSFPPLSPNSGHVFLFHLFMLLVFDYLLIGELFLSGVRRSFVRSKANLLF